MAEQLEWIFKPLWPWSFLFYISVMISTCLIVVEADRDSCLDLLDIIDCWRIHRDPPYCNTSVSPLVECAERVRKAVESCDDGNYSLAADITTTVYKARDDAICQSSKLRSFFRTSHVCWNQAKSCTQHITFSMPKKLPFDCPEKYADYYECKKKSPESCYYYMERLFKSMYRASPCSGTVTLCQWTLLVLTSTLTILRYLSNG